MREEPIRLILIRIGLCEEIMPKISVIIGAYNCSDTIEEAFDSILKQTYTDWQIVVCDDGSSDNTYEIIKKYKEKYPHKFIIKKNEENMGLNYTLNKCLSVADSEYIARMDGDDVSLPTRFEKEAGFLDNHPEYSIVSTPMQYFDDSGVFKVGKGNGEPELKSMSRGTPFCHAPCMVRKEAYDAVNGYSVDDKLLRVEDWHLWIKMYALGYKGYVLDEPLYMMRDDRNATNRRKFKYRIHESRVVCFAVKELKLPKYHYIFAFRPIIVGLLPRSIYTLLHRKR